MENKYQEQLKNWMNQWQQRFEEMRVQFSLGKMDTVEAFEKQKNQLREAIVALKSNLDLASESADEQLTNMKARLEELQVQLNLGKADGMDVFNEQKKKIEQALHELKTESKSAYHKGYEQALHIFDHNATAFKTGLEIIQLQFALGKMDAKDEADNIRKELNEKLNDMQTIFAENQKLLISHMDEWTKLWQGNMEKMKSWAEQWKK
ncbi:MAG: hypothetical protein ACK5GX_00375 [Bacteroidota bacterium]|jgi:hypothetical protein